jgi:hypothetical protein
MPACQVYGQVRSPVQRAAAPRTTPRHSARLLSCQVQPAPGL